MANRPYLTVCAIVRDESPYLEEWVEYHRLLGVDHFYLYDNESALPVSETLRRQISDGYVTVSQVHGRGQQLGTYLAHSLKHRGESVWTAFLDVDEFIAPKSTNDLQYLLTEFESFGGLAINWQVFGGNGYMTRQENLTIASYTQKLPTGHPMNQHVKSIVRLEDICGWPDPHRPLLSNGIFTVNESGKPVGGPFSPPSTERIQINHYITRSAEEWSLKVAKGRADGATLTRSEEEGAAINSLAKETDEIASRFANAVRHAIRCGRIRFPCEIPGWLSEIEGRELARLASGGRVLEIGSYCGRSTICLAQRAKSVTALDPFDGRATPDPRPTLEDFLANVQRYGVSDIVVPRQGMSDEVCPDLPGKSFDLVFIDGSHDETSVDNDIQHARRMLVSGGVICGHDYYDSPYQWPGVKTTVDKFVYRTGGRLRRLGSLWIIDWPYRWEEV